MARLLAWLNLYSFNLNQIRQTWNLNRFLVIIGLRLRVADVALTTKLENRRGKSEFHLSSRIYRPWHVSSRVWPDDFRPDLLVVAQHGRFGNMIRQLSLAIAVAERLGTREVLVKSLPEFPRGTWSLDNGVTLTNDPFFRARMIARPRLVLGGDFFVRQRLPIDIEGIDFPKIGRSLFDLLQLGSLEPIDPSTLVIHFRSGDVFGSRPHKDLGQPPYSFYEKLIKIQEPLQAILVFEDDANPVIAKVKDFLVLSNIPFVVQSSRFQDDLRVLLSASSLVTSLGTLAEALVFLSPHLKNWIHYGPHRNLVLKGKPVDSITAIDDSSGDYARQLLSGNWKNHPGQQKVMLEFPTSRLSVLKSS